ncbi:MAG: D-Ala-D-Ala carboxypeptidase family metallohydrolase [Dehalococcoidia bacterium]|nr:D-Ala-D-Ala carboxypeptidase family metallohydrolase [Dehalococcoidia bacterium]
MSLNQTPFDRFTASHVGIGAFMGAVGWSRPLAYGFAVVWEIVEEVLRPRFIGFSNDSGINKVVDVAANVTGYEVARAWTRKGRPWRRDGTGATLIGGATLATWLHATWRSIEDADHDESTETEGSEIDDMAKRTRLSPHFTREEFDSRDGTPYPERWIAPRLTPLVAVLEDLRARVGERAITILSGYRSPAHNRAVGGARASQHMEGRAADIRVAGMTPAQVHAELLAMYNEGDHRIGGLGLYNSFVHVDVRPSGAGRLARWTGSRVSADA